MKIQRFLMVMVMLQCLVANIVADDYVVPADSGVYRIVNLNYGLAMAEDFTGNKMICNEIEGDDSYTQLWELRKNGSGWTIRNLYTGNYISGAGAFYTQVTTSNVACTYYLKTNSVFENSFNLWHTSSVPYSLHCDADNNIVPWYKGSGKVTASEWGFSKVELSDSAIAAAKEKYRSYKDIIENSEDYCNGYTAFFADAACTELKPEYSSLSDSDLREAMDAYKGELLDVALKIKNNTWSEYEKEFRIHSYEPYSDVDKWDDILKITTYSYLSNPTGIYANTGDLIYIFVGNDIPENATLQVDRVYMNAVSGIRSELKKGMNIIPVGRGNSMLYILYTVDTTGDKVLADFDSLDIHIEGGILNGYWDKKRHTDTDWVNITRKLATYKYIQVKGDKILLNMDKEALTASDCVPEKITECIGWWDQMQTWQHELMGLDVDGTLEKFNNLHCARTKDDATTMSSGAYNTNYPPHTLAGIMSYEKMMNGCNFWGPAHEVGHANQGAINMIGCTEVSNNIFSNVVLYKFGRYMSRGGIISETSTNYENAVPYSTQNEINIMHMTRMFWQLYLYYHVAGHKTDFFPQLFIALRNDKLVKKTGSSYTNNGDSDLLKFALKCCEVAGEDLTDFFNAWGFFIPMNRAKIGDYGNYYLTSTEAMIKTAKEAMSAYPKAAAIEFIEDRIAYYSRTDGVEGNRLNIDYNVGEAGDLGQFTAYMSDSIKTHAEGYLYSKFGNKVTFSKGTGAVGFRIYSNEDSLLTFCNTLEYMLPDNIASRELKYMAVSADGTESEVVSVYNGTEEDQLAALNNALALALTYVRKIDTSGKKVGYYYAYALQDLKENYYAAKSAVDSCDQSLHTYGEWAKLLADEFDEILADSRAKIKLNPKNYYKLTNASYIKYTAYRNDDGTLGCAMTSSVNTRFAFVPVSSGSNLYYIKSKNGEYIDKVERSTVVTATTTSKSSALKFRVYEMENAKFEIQSENVSAGYLHCDSKYRMVGWYNDGLPSQWTITCVEDNQAKEDDAALLEHIEQADSLLKEIVDTIASTENNIVLYNYVTVIDDKIYEYISELINEKKIAEALYATGTTVLFPEECEKLVALMTLIKKSYSISTGIENITLGRTDCLDGNMVIYDINGRRVNEIVAGRLYIVNGKKIRISE